MQAGAASCAATNTRGITAADAAGTLRNNIQAYVQSGALPPDRILVDLQGFGHWNDNGPSCATGGPAAKFKYRTMQLGLAYPCSIQ